MKKSKAPKIIELIKEMFKRKVRIYYLIDGYNWVLNEIGKSLKINLKQFDVVFSLTGEREAEKITSGVIHLSNRYQINSFKRRNKKEIIVLTYYHGDDSDGEILKKIVDLQHTIKMIHTSCQITKKHLVNNGIVEDKIIVIPIGIDVKMFCPISNEKKEELKEKYGIPKNRFVIGSFQKDGNGWGDGYEPKLIKGPDVFCDVLERLAVNNPIYVLLTGPARGYVKNRLESAKIPYKHLYFNEYKDIAACFNIIDLYIVASKLEGGPRAIMESHAAGVPLISTKVGMAPEIINHGENGFLADIGNVEEICGYAENIIGDKLLREKFVINGIRTVKRYDYEIIAREYYEKIYSK